MTADAVPRVRDPGRQPERTRLSWRRTVLAATMVALLATRLALLAPGAALAVLAVAAVLAGWLALLLLGWRRIRAMAAVEPVPPARSVPLATAAVLGLAVLGVALVLATRQ